MPHTRLGWLRALAILSDATALSLSWATLVYARILFGEWWPYDLVPGPNVFKWVTLRGTAPLALLVVPTWLLALGWQGSWNAVRRKTATRALGEVLVAVATGGVLALALAALLHLRLARTVLFAYALVSVPLLLLTRATHAWALRTLRRGELLEPHHVVSVGTDASLDPWRQVLLHHPEWGARESQHFNAPGPALERWLIAQPVDEVYTADLPKEELTQLGALCAELGIPLTMHATYLTPEVPQALHLDLDGLPVLTLGPAPATLARMTKRALDVVVSGLGLLLLGPLLLLLMGLTRLHDGGPSLFIHPRVGQGGRRFSMLKLRTMVPHAHRQHPRPGDPRKGPFDPRVTPLGRWLRRFSLDELPQLVNVLRGEMSLVGPRPPLPEEVLRYERWQLRRLSVPPGMTGLWQVSGRSTLSWDQWVALDLEYVDRWSLGLDLHLLWRTLPAVLHGEGAW